jgi:hypothetical protein
LRSGHVPVRVAEDAKKHSIFHDLAAFPKYPREPILKAIPFLPLAKEAGI